MIIKSQNKLLNAFFLRFLSNRLGKNISFLLNLRKFGEIYILNIVFNSNADNFRIQKRIAIFFFLT